MYPTWGEYGTNELLGMREAGVRRCAYLPSLRRKESSLETTSRSKRH